MAYTAVDLVNLKSCIKQIRGLQDRINFLYEEYCAQLAVFDSILDRYKDVVLSDDLPL